MAAPFPAVDRLEAAAQEAGGLGNGEPDGAFGVFAAVLGLAVSGVGHVVTPL
jgi:hypothetical protein